MIQKSAYTTSDFTEPRAEQQELGRKFW